MYNYFTKTVYPRENSIRGFTLVELMVSLSVFSIVMVISVGTLLTLIDINAKAQALYSSTTNLSFALDSMTRELRTGYHYYCDESDESEGQTLPDTDLIRDCGLGDSTDRDFIAFTRERDDNRIGYRLNQGYIEQKIESDDWIQITSRDVVIDSFQVLVTGSDPYAELSGPVYTTSLDENQPVVTLFVRGHVGNGLETPTEFNIQTRIVGRRLDNAL